MQVNLYSEAGELLEEAEEDGTSVDRGVRELIQKTDKGKEGYTILRDGESYALHFVSFQEIAERGRGVHIELVRDITGIFLYVCPFGCNDSGSSSSDSVDRASDQTAYSGC